jgi:hypothetical protein
MASLLTPIGLPMRLPVVPNRMGGPTSKILLGFSLKVCHNARLRRKLR